MFINDFQSSNEHRLHQVLHTLKSVHGVELDLENSDPSDLETVRESSEIIKNSIVNESQFNTYNSNPEYAKHMLIMEAVRLYLTEIAPKRQRRKVRESIGAEVDEDMINPAQDPNMQQKTNGQQPNKAPNAAPGMVKVKKGNMEKTVQANQLANLQKQGYSVVGDDVAEAAINIDPELAELMRRYGVQPPVDEGNRFSGALEKARGDGEDSFNLDGKTYRVTKEAYYDDEEEYGGDWGSSDWYPVMKGMDEYLAKYGTTPENIEAAAEQEAEFYHRMMGYRRVDDAKDRIISMWMTRRGIKHTMEEAVETDHNQHSNGSINESQFDHDGYQASMARSELYRNTKYAMDMLKMVKPEDEVQPWIASNLTKAANYLDKIYHYLDYYTKFEPEKLPEDQDPDAETTDMALGETTGSTARQDLMHIVEYSTKLFGMIQPGDKLEGWVAMKLTTASDAISSSKHYMEYQQFEKHAHDMLDDVNGMAEEGAKMKKKSVKESVGQMLMSMMLNEDQDLAQAQTLLAAKAMSDDLQDMAEKVAKMSVEDLMPLVDTMKEQFGMEAAEGYNEMMKSSLEALLKSITDSKDTSDNAILQLQGGGVPSAAGEELPEPGVMPAAGEEPAGDEEAAGDVEAPELPPADEEPLGRAKKDESVSLKGKALNEKWDSEMKTKEKDKGMWDGWTIAELKAEKAKLMKKEERSAAEQKKVKQIDFAIRAKQKDKWGKVDEAKKPGKVSLWFYFPFNPSTYIKTEEKIEKAVGKSSDGSGTDFKDRDISFTIASREEANAAVKRVKALGIKGLKHDINESINESAPPGKKAEDFVKKNKASFKERYGKRWEEVLYATAWKKFGSKSESYLKTEKMLENSLANMSKLEKAFESHKARFKKQVNEGKMQDPLKTGYGLEGELMSEQMNGLGSMISKLREMLRAEIRRGSGEMIMAEHNARKAERLAARKSEAPYGVLWLAETGARKGKFFESEKLRKFWLDLNAAELKEHQLVNPEHFDAEIQKLNSRKG